MHQVNFSNQSISELNKLSSAEQMQIIEELSNINPKELEGDSEDIGKFNRNGKIFYRLRSKSLRIYFEIQKDDAVLCHYILQPHTLTDFIFRFKLPITEEQMIEQHQSFWRYLETLKK